MTFTYDLDIRYPPPSVDVYVGRRDVTHQLYFRNGATLTGAVLGMRRIDFRSERWTDNFQALADDDRALLRCVVVVPGSKPAVEFVRLDVDCKSTLQTFNISAVTLDLRLSSTRILTYALGYTLMPSCSVCRQFFGFFPGSVRVLPISSDDVRPV